MSWQSVARADDVLSDGDQAPSIQPSNTLTAVVGGCLDPVSALRRSGDLVLLGDPVSAFRERRCTGPSSANPSLTPDVAGTYEVSMTLVTASGAITTEKWEVSASPAARQPQSGAP